MHLDVQDLRNFYYRSALGRAAQKSLRGRLLELWPEAKGQTVVGFGFAAPLLRPYLADARRVMVLMHGLETSERPSELLDECWRVLGPGGKALFIVPNRAGMWARRDRTPFGYGRPYSPGQLETQLRKHQFLPERHLGALFQFPSQQRIWMKSAPLFEKIGRQMPTMMGGGAILVEATKLVYPPRGRPQRSTARRAIGVLEGMTEPQAKPV